MVALGTGGGGNAYSDALNVTVSPYTADKTGSQDSTATINAAIAAAVAAGGGVVYFPAGTYKISSALTIGGKNVTLLGAGAGDSFASNLTIIHQTSTTANGVTCTDGDNIIIQGIAFTGPGSGTGKGISNTSSSLPTQFSRLQDVAVRAFGGDGIFFTQSILTSLVNVWSADNGGNGFNFQGNGTSISAQSCWARNNTGKGWLVTGNYHNFSGCASDINGGEGWTLSNCQSVALTGCGSELNTGNQFHLTSSCFGVSLAGCWALNTAIGLLIDASCFRIAVSGFTEAPSGSPTASIQVASGGIASIIQPNVSTAMNLVNAGFFTPQVLDDGFAVHGFPLLAYQASTGAAGYTLVNGTGTILTWTAPNDGAMHRALVWVVKHVTVQEVGGGIRMNYTLPDGTTVNYTVDAGGSAPGVATQYTQPWNLLVQANSTITITQNTALTSGASKQWAEIWAS